ncbi:hypothetical protein KAFR_0B04850 [Kazachstania africana CBS 2517]|uniref:Mitochondrial carrier protein n=1 Tax=Kazachstania africana (strain ATCC 22294 / BCRC 22015 / CBS 2517 / CECT 1963 / NBRC 1671 / NRRL Y-8276) TaxID=1071382 RepID=H2AQY1_KAZAF|nr:hypothetical protein KAFR_0B04850 [Kazachstania africana CBS 2517]CCF56781.1 hypothetical protein KAFR_0B04850 [Kazachstania africana CBS 2517]
MWLFSSSIPVVNTPHQEDQNVRSTQRHSFSPPPLPAFPPSSNQDDLAATSPISHCFLSGAIGGVIGDSVMHSLDTVKTRQQGSSAAKYKRNLPSTYGKILLEEGLTGGLYSGYMAAMLGSFPTSGVFFATYEYSKRVLINDFNVNDTVSHLCSGLLGDFVSSFIYVPSEVLKTRLQLQGKYNNAFSQSNYNYKNLSNAIHHIIKTEGAQTLFFGYKATLARDLPFSALQLAFYEKFRKWAILLEDTRHLSIGNEILTGAAAGGLAGMITTPLDVVKTRLQTQKQKHQQLRIPSSSILLSNSLTNSMKVIFQNEGVLGLFSGVGPRFIWTSVQSSIMLLLYQMTLKKLNQINMDSSSVPAF